MHNDDRERFNQILDEIEGSRETGQVVIALAGFGLGFLFAVLSFVACYQIGVLS